MKLVKGISVLSAAILLAACGGDDNNSSLSVPTTYTFESKVLGDDTSSVATSGQITRHLLINELKNYIGSPEFQGLTDKAEALANLNFIYKTGTKNLDSDKATQPSLTSVDVYGVDAVTPVNTSIGTDGATKKQTIFSDLSSDKNLQGKLAGNSVDLTHAEFVGWDVSGEANLQAKPDALIQIWFDQLATLATDEDVTTTVVTAEGLDLQQLVQKFLLGGVTYSQAAEKYLNPALFAAKQNSGEDKANKAYTSLEHVWDEGFGYFGAARDYLAYSDTEMAGQADHDTNEDAEIDFESEFSFGNSINAVKRDKGSTDLTSFSENAMGAFLKGRAVIQANYGNDLVADEGYHVELSEISKTALNNWENSIAATIVHYINDVTEDMDKFGTEGEDGYSLAKHAKHWSEMKGFALGLQFSPVAVAQISLDDLKAVHAKLKEAPVLSTASAEDITAYKTALLEARTILQTSYGFSAENVANW